MKPNSSSSTLFLQMSINETKTKIYCDKSISLIEIESIFRVHHLLFGIVNVNMKKKFVYYWYPKSQYLISNFHWFILDRLDYKKLHLKWVSSMWVLFYLSIFKILYMSISHMSESELNLIRNFTFHSFLCWEIIVFKNTYVCQMDNAESNIV